MGNLQESEGMKAIEAGAGVEALTKQVRSKE